MHPYANLKELLRPLIEKLGYREVYEEICPDAFGSAYSIFRSDRGKLRIIWDGKDGWGYVQKGGRDLPFILRKDDLESCLRNEEKISEFISAIEKACHQP
ncbi:MAG: hypothetical protein DMF69_12870 [Acidobacteria bacterium]|nr:MAG: hypothetical protein DMF69_12870 [Acidobacteriota bacterium]